MNFAKELQNLLQKEVLQNEPMKKHTTWQIGGAADYFIRPVSESELVAVLPFIYAAQKPFTVIGNGSNLLVGDKGIRGVVIQLGAEYAKTEWLSDGLISESGAMLTPLVMEAAKHDLCGMEYLAGIPGSLGGAVLMNAGAYGFHIGNIVTTVWLVEYNGNIRQLNNEDLRFSYRMSSLSELDGIISRVRLNLTRGNSESAKSKIRELLALRAAKQPLEYPSCGSVFKNPQNDHAGRLIEAAGLKSKRVGDAMVSPKHGNFIINLGNANACEVLELINIVKSEVKRQFGVELAAEVRLLGE